MRPGIAALVALVLLVAAAPAAASSIVVVRGGDLYLVTPDGAFERRLTTGGGYDSPSMADDGTIVALQGRSFVRLRADGGMLEAPVNAVGGDWMVARGPFDPRVSPDGLRIAYWFSGRRRLCLPTQPGCTLRDTEFAAYSYAGRATDPLELGVVADYREPSWMGSGRTLLFNYLGGPNETVAVNRVGGESALEGWFSYDDGTQLGQGQATRAGDRLAAVAGRDEIHLFGITAPPPALPALRCIVRAAGYATPTWSPDGTMLAWAQEDGVHVAGPIPALDQPVPDCSVIRERRLGEGSDPFWGPADVPGAPAPAPPRALSRPAASRPLAAFRSLRAARRQHGRSVRLRLRILHGPARVDARLTLRGHGAGRLVVRRAPAGTLRLRVRLGRRARAALAVRGLVRLRLRVRVSAPGRATGTARRRVTLRAVKTP